MSTSYTLSEIAELVGGKLRGNPQTPISGVNTLSEAGSQDIVYLQDLRYRDAFDSTRAAAAIVPRGFDTDSLPTIVVDRPRLAFTRVMSLFSPLCPPVEPGIHPSALIPSSVQMARDVSIGAYVIIGERTRLGDNVSIGPLSYIGDDVEIGEGSYIYQGVIVRERVLIGRNCIIHPGAVLGSDGFGFELDPEGIPVKIPQTGDLILEDDVEIGANVTIDRAVMGRTTVARGTKLDNLVHVAHNVQIGSNCMLCAQVGVAGSTTIGRNCILGGQAGLVDHLIIGNGVRIGAQAGVTKSIPEGATVSGYPARSHREALKKEAMVSRLSEMFERIAELTSKIEEIEERQSNDERGCSNKK